MPPLAATEERSPASPALDTGRPAPKCVTPQSTIPNAATELLQRARVSIVLASLTAAIPLLLFSLALVERKWKVLLNRGPFLLEQPLPFWEKIPFVLFFAVALLVLVVTASSLLWWILRHVFGAPTSIAKWTVVPVALAYLTAITAQYKVAQYFRDGLSLAVIRGLGGGNWTTALHYVQEEFAGLLPPIAAALLAMVLGGWLVRRYSGRLQAYMAQRWFVRVLASPRGLLAANVILLLCPWLLFRVSFPLHENLRFGIAYQIYGLPTSPLTDWDPGAIRANGDAGNTVATSVPLMHWQQATTPWSAAALQPRNVLLIVMESARYDLLDAEVNGTAVMPTLRSVPGERLLMFSHSGYTTTSLNAMFNGTMDEKLPGIPLVDRFHALGYQTGVFSAQFEGFGDTAAHTHMDRADVFVDAGSFPKEQRMYANAADSALSIPAPFITTRFGDWLGSLDRDRPFFAYINWQEMHFPYHYWGEPTPIANPPIPRGKIVRGNREWLDKTYWNAARNVDTELGKVLALLERYSRRSDTVILVIGDHGEELFDHGYLGHGINISFEQNATLAKLINSIWKPPEQAYGQSSVSTILHNALVRSPQDALPLDEGFLCYIGDPKKPVQLATVTPEGLIKFDFKRKRWLRQPGAEKEFVPTENFPPLVGLWDLYLQQPPAENSASR